MRFQNTTETCCSWACQPVVYFCFILFLHLLCYCLHLHSLRSFGTLPYNFLPLLSTISSQSWDSHVSSSVLSGTHTSTSCNSANLKQVSNSTPSQVRVKVHRRVCAHWISAAVWSTPEEFWSIFVSEIHHTKYIFSLLTHYVRHKKHIRKIIANPIDLQNGKKMDFWCKYYLFLAYSGTCLGLSK